MAADPQYSTRQLVRVVESLPRPHSFLLDTFFGGLILFDTEEIDFDLIPSAEELAPFVSPEVRGRVMKDQGFNTRSYKPAYVKPKHRIDPNKPFKRRPGERIGGELTPAIRYDAAVAELLVKHREMLIRRKEWMAAQAMLKGKIIVEGEDFPRQELDFGRDALLTVTLAPGSKWGDAGVNPLRELESYAGTVQTASGAASTSVVMTPDVWPILSSDDDFMKVLDNRRQVSGSAEMGPTLTATEDRSARFMGTVGDFDFWTYNDSYIDDDGIRQQMLPEGTVLLGGSRIEGVQCHGAIRDKKAKFHALEIFPKIIEEEDPAGEELLSQSAPLVVPARPDASMSITVK